jgi:threonine dehydratase
VIHTEKKLTIADGLRTNVGEPNFAIIKRYVDDIVTVSEEAIISAMRKIWETMKIIVEPSAAVPFAAVQGRQLSRGYGSGSSPPDESVQLADKIDVAGQRVGIILTGGNVDLDALPWNR